MAVAMVTITNEQFPIFLMHVSDSIYIYSKYASILHDHNLQWMDEMNKKARYLNDQHFMCHDKCFYPCPWIMKRNCSENMPYSYLEQFSAVLVLL